LLLCDVLPVKCDAGSGVASKSKWESAFFARELHLVFKQRREFEQGEFQKGIFRADFIGVFSSIQLCRARLNSGLVRLSRRLSRLAEAGPQVR
jgi:hypothetical protein